MEANYKREKKTKSRVECVTRSAGHCKQNISESLKMKRLSVELTPEESYLRIMNITFCFTIFLLILASIFTWISSYTIFYVPKIIVHHYIKNVAETDIQPRNSILFNSVNNSIWKISIDSKFQFFTEHLFNLPPSQWTYFSFKDIKNHVYFIRQDLQSEIIEYHKSLKKGIGHQKIKGSKTKISPGIKFLHGVLIGNMFWVLGKYPKGTNFTFLPLRLKLIKVQSFSDQMSSWGKKT